jgi:hypothetical protein
VTGVVGIIRTVDVVTAQTTSGLTYSFEGWAGGGAQSHQFALPEGGDTEIANFHLSKVGDGTGPGDNQLFVAGLYHDLLGRPVDDFGTSVLAAQLDQARFPVLSSIAQGFVASQEERGNLIRSYYLKYLGRGADQNEVDLWLRGFAAGMSTDAVQSQIAGSIEAFQDQNQDPAQWLNKVFRELLGRDAAGADLFLNLLRSGTPRAFIVLAILGSAEYRGNVIASAYQTYLGRQASAAEIQGWLGWMSRFPAGVGPLGATERFQVGVLASEEFFRRGGNANGGWAELMYTDFLGRPPDAGGLRGTIATLYAGYAAARQNVANLLQQTDEYLSHKVQTFYNLYLGRQAGPDEVARWVRSLHQGASQEDVIAVILASDEYYQRHNSNNMDWLDAVYSDAFHRVRDQVPSQPLLDALNTGTPRQAIAAFVLSSDEYRHDVVKDAFDAYLRRDPEGPEGDFGAQSLQHGARDEQLISVVLASEEYFQGVRTFP